LIRARKLKGIFFASLKRTLEGERSKTTKKQKFKKVLPSTDYGLDSFPPTEGVSGRCAKLTTNVKVGNI